MLIIILLISLLLTNSFFFLNHNSENYRRQMIKRSLSQAPDSSPPGINCIKNNICNKFQDSYSERRSLEGFPLSRSTIRSNTKDEGTIDTEKIKLLNIKKNKDNSTGTQSVRNTPVRPTPIIPSFKITTSIENNDNNKDRKIIIINKKLNFFV